MTDHALELELDEWLDAAAETVNAWEAWRYADTNASMRKARLRFEASIDALKHLLDPDGEMAAEAKAQAMEP